MKLKAFIGLAQIISARVHIKHVSSYTFHSYQSSFVKHKNKTILLRINTVYTQPKFPKTNKQVFSYKNGHLCVCVCVWVKYIFCDASNY